MADLSPDKRGEEECSVCGGRPAACRILGHRPESDRNIKWRETTPSHVVPNGASCDPVGESRCDPAPGGSSCDAVPSTTPRIPAYYIAVHTGGDPYNEFDFPVAENIGFKLSPNGAWMRAHDVMKAFAVSAIALKPPSEEIAWVIVRDLPGDLGYFDGLEFQPNNLSAIRFARRIDADRMLTLLHGSSAHEDRVEEHQWG